MAKIVFFHNALGKTDGVSLEVDKWRLCLERMGHEVFYCAGNDDSEQVHCIPELDFFHPVTKKLIHNATVELEDFTAQALVETIREQADIVKIKIKAYLEEIKPDCIIPNNLLSVGYHIPATIALSETIRELRIPTINHNHDFYFEDSGEVNPTCPEALSLLEEYAPPTGDNIINLTINSIARDQLFERKHIKATIVPNVFDFDQPQWQKDAYNADFRSAMGTSENDIVFQQATRVMDRKGIELAIDLIARAQEHIADMVGQTLYNGKKIASDSQCILLCSGRIEKFGISGSYQAALETHAKEKGVAIKFAGDKIKHSRGEHPERGKIYSLWDSYVYSDFVTYPSWWEGWGNQFIEAVFAKLPVVLFEYPVYTADLKQKNFQVVSLGQELAQSTTAGLVAVEDSVITKAAAAVVELLTDSSKREHAVSKNFEIAKQYYSLDVLSAIISQLLTELGVSE